MATSVMSGMFGLYFAGEIAGKGNEIGLSETAKLGVAGVAGVNHVNYI